MDFAAYSDESYIRTPRFRSISVFTFPLSNKTEILRTLKSNLNSSNIQEFKWEKLRTAKYRFCAIKFLNTIFDSLYKRDIRIDTIIWDTHDRRHTVTDRDDIKNFERMFFHLHRSALRRRPKNSNWNIHPDERMEIDWATIRDCLSAVGRRHELIKSPLFGEFFSDRHYQISEFQEVHSIHSPCCQLADLFAGMAVFSITHNSKFWLWNWQNTPSLFKQPDVVFSCSEIERFQVLDYFNCGCKDKKLRVSLSTDEGLKTYKPSYPLNFWLYRPQHDKDKAPTRKKSLNKKK